MKIFKCFYIVFFIDYKMKLSYNKLSILCMKLIFDYYLNKKLKLNMEV